MIEDVIDACFVCFYVLSLFVWVVLGWLLQCLFMIPLSDQILQIIQKFWRETKIK